jgi:hypothetical protein
MRYRHCLHSCGHRDCGYHPIPRGSALRCLGNGTVSRKAPFVDLPYRRTHRGRPKAQPFPDRRRSELGGQSQPGTASKPAPSSSWLPLVWQGFDEVAYLNDPFNHFECSCWIFISHHRVLLCLVRPAFSRRLRAAVHRLIEIYPLRIAWSKATVEFALGEACGRAHRAAAADRVHDGHTCRLVAARE